MPPEHHAMATAVLNRDVLAAQEAIAQHLHKTADMLLRSPLLPASAT